MKKKTKWAGAAVIALAGFGAIGALNPPDKGATAASTGTGTPSSSSASSSAASTGAGSTSSPSSSLPSSSISSNSLRSPAGSTAGNPARIVAVSTMAARAQLAGLVVKGRAPKTGYSRARFGTAWTDDVSVAGGHNGCDTRIIYTT